MHIIPFKRGPGRFILSILMITCSLLLLSACGGLQGDGTTGESQASSPQPTVHPSTSMQAEQAFTPTRLLIPSINVNAPIEQVGIASDGTLATPVSHPWDGVGWYNAGPRPGERGSAVIDGHLDRPGGAPAVFWNLKNLQIGNQVQIVDATGKTLRFHVDRVETYTPQDAPNDEIFGDTSGHFLNLITCAGTWIPTEHQTTERLVVYTSQIA